MTFTEAAVEVLRRAGKPLHYAEIAEQAVKENLLSHVGQDPEVTMGQRLAAMAKRDDERKVVAIAPQGTFALTEWSVPAEVVIEAVAPPLHPAEDGEKQYRENEREPRPINAQARRRMEALLGGEEPEPVEDEREPGERKERGEKRGRDRERGPGQRRFPPPAEVAFEWLAQKQSGAPLAELAEALAKRNLLSEGLAHDVPSLTAALLEDNRRRTEAGRKPVFIVDGERVTLVEFPPPSALAEISSEARAPQTGLGRPTSAAALVAEGRRAVVRALRSRLAELETNGFEQVCALLLERMGMRDVRVAKRSKEGPLYLARQRRGVSDLRVAVKLVRGKREIARPDVQDLRKDLAHYSSQMGLVLAAGEAGREARAEASSAGQAPVALYAGEALAEELVGLRVGVHVQVVELADVDEAFFLAAAKAGPQHGREGREGKEGRERDDRPPRREREPGAPEGAAAASSEGANGSDGTASASSAAADSSPDIAAAQSAEAAPPLAEPSAAEEAPSGPIDREAVSSEGGGGAAAEPTDADRPRGEDREPRDARRRGRKVEPERDRPQRITSASEQAWGQPAGTPSKRMGAAVAPIALDRPGDRLEGGAGDEEEAVPIPGEASEISESGAASAEGGTALAQGEPAPPQGGTATAGQEPSPSPSDPSGSTPPATEPS